MPTLTVEPLTREAFAPFGDVIDADPSRPAQPINEGTALRYAASSSIEVTGGGHAVIARVRAQPRVLPFDVAMLERHPLGSQAFVPLAPDLRYVVVVATAPDAAPRAFLAANGQGVNYRAGTWHHPLIALDRVTEFLVIDRAGAGANCDEVRLAQPWQIEHA